MKPPEIQRARRSGTAIDGALALIGILVIGQIWVLTATLEAFLAGHMGAALPGAIGSLMLFAANLGLYRFVAAVDRRRDDDR
jgi:hypothetical protein